MKNKNKFFFLKTPNQKLFSNIGNMHLGICKKKYIYTSILFFEKKYYFCGRLKNCREL